MQARKSAFQQQLDVAVGMLESAEIPEILHSPPVYRLFWSMGYSVPPPHFTPVAKNLTTIGTIILVVLGSLAAGIFGLRIGPSLRQITMVALEVSFAVTAAAAIYYKVSASRHSLPDWGMLSWRTNLKRWQITRVADVLPPNANDFADQPKALEFQ